MENLSPTAISKLREVFNQMTDSRRHLRPILIDIASSIDKGFFIDAGSEEVTELLKKILEAQEQFSEIEQVRRAANTRRLDQVDKTISTLEQNCKRDELASTLEKIFTLEVDSEEQSILDAVKKVKLQAEHIKHKSNKWDISHFAKETEKFSLLVEVVENIEHFSPETYLKVVNSFADNPLIAMALTNKLVHFPRPVQVEETFDDTTDFDEEKIIDVAKSVSNEPNKHRLRAVMTKFEKVNPNPILIETNDDNIKIEHAAVKKQLTLKSFNNKLHEFLESVDPIQLFRVLIRVRIFYKQFPKSIAFEHRFSKKLAALTPTLLERLFNWGVVDKITWRDRQFYFINSFGLDLAMRSFTRNSSPSSVENYSAVLRTSVQLSLLIFVEQYLSKRFNFCLTGGSRRYKK